MTAIPKITLDRESEAYMRATAAGFYFKECELLPDNYIPGYILRCEFYCVCGQVEMISKSVSNMSEMQYIAPAGLWDAAQELERMGSFSAAHLHADGFSATDIKRIRFVYDMWDELKELRRMKEIYESVTMRYAA